MTARPGRLRVAFAGTPAFALTSLEALDRAGFDVALVLTQPDRAAGRGQRPTASPVKAFAVAAGLPLLQPRGLRLDGRHAGDAEAVRDAVATAALDAIVVAAYGLILPPWLLDAPRHGCLNVHASLLPRWRGAAPVQRAIEAGDATTGVTLMQMDAGLDTGGMLLVRETAIAAADTAATLTARLAVIGAELAVEGLSRLERGDALPARSQPADGVTYAAKLDKREAAIDWRDGAAVIERRLRAFDPFPGARGVLGGETITCWRGEARRSAGPGPADAGAADPGPDVVAPGSIVAVEAGALVVACGDGDLALLELQRPGGRRLSASDFLRGRAPVVGQRFEPLAPA